MKSAELQAVATLIRKSRTAALGTCSDNAPFVSLVAYAAEADFGGVLLHLSKLALHTRSLLANPPASLLIAEQDDGRTDPQTLARITLLGHATPISREAADFEQARTTYLARLPESAMLFGFGDFVLFRFVPTEARFVGGFARAYTLTPEHLREAASL